MNDDHLQRDAEKIYRVARGDVDRSPGALLERVLGTALGIAALLWFGAMFLWVPDPVPGELWIGAGLFVGIGLGGPLGLVFWLRRGGSAVVRAAVRDVMR